MQRSVLFSEADVDHRCYYYCSILVWAQRVQDSCGMEVYEVFRIQERYLSG